MAKRGNGFLNLGWVISLILCFFGIGIIFAIIERIMRGRLLGALVTFFGWGLFILWILDVYSLIVKKDIYTHK